MIKKLINYFIKKNPSAISFKQGFDLTNIPVVTFYQGNQKINFILDTGASENIIDKEFLKCLEHTEEKLTDRIWGIEGNGIAVNSCFIKISYNDIQFNTRFLVNDLSKVFTAIRQSSGVILHGILGSGFFNQYKYVLDFDSLVAYIK